MLHHPTLQKLQQLRLSGMHKALAEQSAQSLVAELSFEERLGLLADRELSERENRRLQTRLRQAKLKHNACIEDIDYRAPRGLHKALLVQLDPRGAEPDRHRSHRCGQDLDRLCPGPQGRW